MARYEGCAICIKVCPIQRYGMHAVMEHYVETGEVLGKGTENLEGYEFKEKGYFPPGKLPRFNREFFDIPHGRTEDWLFEQFMTKLEEKGSAGTEELVSFASQVKTVLDRGRTTRGDE